MDLIRNKPLDEALAILQYTPKAACEPLLKLVKSAAANAENNFNMDKNNLYVAECYVCPGPTLKRMMPRAQGRGYRIVSGGTDCHLVSVDLRAKNITGLDADKCYRHELDRVHQPEVIEKIKRKHATKAVVSAEYRG